MIPRRLQDAATLENHTEHELDPVFRCGYHPGRPAAACAAVVDLQPRQALLHDRADGNRSTWSRYRGVIGLAGVRLRALIGAAGFSELPALRVDVVVSLGRSFDPVHGKQARVEPLR